VITGLSGSGKSSLAFDTIYAEGQRRYVESLSAYARQFLDQMERPEVDSIEGLSPSIAIEQKTTTRSPRSTVGTITEISDFLRVIYSSIGVPHCPNCGKPIARQSAEQIVQSILRGELAKPGDRVMILAPLARGRKGEYKQELEKLARDGFLRVRIDGELFPLDDTPKLDKRKNHTIEVVVDRLLVKPGIAGRLEQSLTTALKLAKGLVTVAVVGGAEEIYSEKLACRDCGISVPQLEPRSFSFNSPYGACPVCNGLGSRYDFDPAKVIVDWSRPLFEGGWARIHFGQFAAHFGTCGLRARIRSGHALREISAPRAEPDSLRLSAVAGERQGGRGRAPAREPRKSKTGAGIPLPGFSRCSSATSKIRARIIIANGSRSTCLRALRRVRTETPAAGKPRGESRWIFDRRFHHAADQPGASRRSIACENYSRGASCKSPGARFRKSPSAWIFFWPWALAISALDRSAATLSGGESQRIRLATQIGSRLRGVLYVLDEPSIGLHARDNDRLLGSLAQLRDLGNTVLVVEHDEETIRRADFVVDLGPGAGHAGGHWWPRENPRRSKPRIRLAYRPLSFRRRDDSGARASPCAERQGFVVLGCTENNLKNIDLRLPLGLLTVITGVSGSGKSTLVNDILYRALAQKLYRSTQRAGAFRELTGAKTSTKSSRSTKRPSAARRARIRPPTPACLRRFANFTPCCRNRASAATRPGRFSFNVKGGRCEACQGDGQRRIEMNFLPDVFVTCEVCRGKRYNAETLAVRYKGLSISDLLNLPIEEALPVLENIPQIHQKLETLVDVGLGYSNWANPPPRFPAAKRSA
jgi:excinuclease ABC subunit A